MAIHLLFCNNIVINTFIVIFGLNNKKQLLAVMVDLTSEEKLKHMSLGQTLDLIKSLSTKQLFEAI